MTGFFLSYGMQDYSATAFWMNGEDSLVYTRLFLIAGLLGGGILCNLLGNHMVLNTSFSLLAMGFVAMAFQYRGASSLIGFSCVQAAGAVFSVSSRLVFLDIARFYKKPVLVCSLGLVFPLILKLFGIISADILYKTWGNMSIFIVSLVAILAALPLVSLLFEKLRDSFMASLRVQSPDIDLASSLELISDSCHADAGEVREPAAPEDESAVEPQNPANWADMARDFARKYAFNPRETQVLELTLHGLSVAEMAQSLCIAEPTVKHYVSQALRKTGTKNRRQLLSMLIREQSPDAEGSPGESC
jgi:DNA-binding CsgD family transcriptional regulator